MRISPPTSPCVPGNQVGSSLSRQSSLRFHRIGEQAARFSSMARAWQPWRTCRPRRSSRNSVAIGTSRDSIRTGQEAQVVDSVPDTRRLDPHGREAAMAREGLAAPSCWMRSRKIGARHRALGEILRRLVGRVSLRPDATSAFSGAGCRRRGVGNSCHRDLSFRRVPSSLGKSPTSRCGPETRELAP